MRLTATLWLAFFSSLAFAMAQDRLGPVPKRARTPNDYEPRTLAQLNGLRSESPLGDKQERMTVHPELFPSRVQVTYGGSQRPLPELKKEVIRQWARLYAGNPDGYTTPYETEFLFREAGVDHWLAVSTRSLDEFKNSMKAGERVDLDVIRMGNVKSQDGWESVILVENFMKR